jgi:hypothetical protein
VLGKVTEELRSAYPSSVWASEANPLTTEGMKKKMTLSSDPTAIMRESTSSNQVAQQEQVATNSSWTAIFG